MNKTILGPVSILETVFQVLAKNPVIFSPIICLGFIQLLFLEIIYFAPRYPLSGLFGPIIAKTAGPIFLHYPYNYLLLSKWYHSTDVWSYIFINCIFYGAAVMVISLVHGDKQPDLRQVFHRARSSYFHLVAAMIVMVISMMVSLFLYRELYRLVALVHATDGFFALVKRVLIVGAPFYQLLTVCLISALFAFVIPIIMVEQKKIIPALVLNFKGYGHLWALVFTVLLITEIPYLPFILIRSARLDGLLAFKFPELSGVYLVISTVVILLISVFQYTAIMLCYFFKSEEVS